MKIEIFILKIFFRVLGIKLRNFGIIICEKEHANYLEFDFSFISDHFYNALVLLTFASSWTPWLFWRAVKCGCLNYLIMKLDVENMTYCTHCTGCYVWNEFKSYQNKENKQENIWCFNSFEFFDFSNFSFSIEKYAKLECSTYAYF